MSDYIELKKFSDFDLNDPFFKTLKEDYLEFEDWFKRKAKEKAYAYCENDKVVGFLYLKIENGPITDITPKIKDERVLKIGTFKINPHGTRLGERFIKKTLDYAISNNIKKCYLTIFEKHKALIDLLKKYGFYEYGIKNSKNGKEKVLLKDMKVITGNVLHDYPIISSKNVNKFLLAIYPCYHTNMFPDSILYNETFDILDDVSHTNSIHKIYVCSMPVYKAKYGDIIVIYRTSDNRGPAEFRSVATSICVVEEVYSKSDFKNFETFYDYANQYSIFDKNSLQQWYNKDNCYTIKMTYNAALTKRLTRRKLADEVGLDRGERWSFIEITDMQFKKILELGEVNESLVVD